jgi:hypothetical protein
LADLEARGIGPETPSLLPNDATRERKIRGVHLGSVPRRDFALCVPRARAYDVQAVVIAAAGSDPVLGNVTLHPGAPSGTKGAVSPISSLPESAAATVIPSAGVHVVVSVLTIMNKELGNVRHAESLSTDPRFVISPKIPPVTSGAFWGTP